MASRKYYRDNRGRFAGSAGAAAVTYGRAGGFANGAFQSRVSAGRLARPRPTASRAARTLTGGASRGAQALKTAQRQQLRWIGRQAGGVARDVAVTAAIGVTISGVGRALGGGRSSRGVRKNLKNTNRLLAAGRVKPGTGLRIMPMKTSGLVFRDNTPRRTTFYGSGA